MFSNSRVVSISLAALIASVTVAFISLFQGVGYLVLLIAFLVCFCISFILFFFTLEFLIFKEVKELHKTVEKLKKKEFKHSRKKIKPSLSPIKQLNEEIYAYVSKKQREIDQLKKLEVYRREFLANVSHELKTPIFAAQGFVHTLLDGAIDDEAVRDKFLKKAAKSLDGLNDLVQDLLTLSKMEAGFIKMNFEPFDLYEICKNVYDQMEQKAKEKNIGLKFSDEYGEVYVYADKIRIKQVMINLVENAIKYGHQDGSVQISFHEEMLDEKENRHFFGEETPENAIEPPQKKVKKVVVTVEDDGQGIGAEHLDRIFERFYRVDKSRSKDKGGSGLGLAIVKHTLEAHQSLITVKSKKRKGTTFRFALHKVNPWESEDIEEVDPSENQIQRTH